MGVRKGCYQCTKRRILCDQTEPQCLKCIAKGLECSGNGLRYRFNDGIASRGKFRGHTTPAAQACKSPISRRIKRSEATQDSSKPCSISRQDHANHEVNSHLIGRYYPQPVDACTRAMMDFFSTNIAPGMVILDGRNNGYRSLILPFALQDKLVQQAVTSVAALQFSHFCSSMRPAAEVSREQVIKQLKQSAMAPDPGQVFTISAWMTILVLLVGELAQGGDHYTYLLRMMYSIKRHGVKDPNSELLKFLNLQTDMILHLAQPFIGPTCQPFITEQCLKNTLLKSEGCDKNNADKEILQIVVEAVQVCSDICKSDANRSSQLDRLKQLVSLVPPGSAGGSSLVWAYFIGAAESESIDDRIFFTSCLVEIYNWSNWQNIIMGLGMLEQLWQHPQRRSWRQNLPQICTAFVM